MGKRENQRGKLDREVVEEDERIGISKKSAVVTSSSDDEEANEDLSLKIVEKSLLMRAARLVPDKDIVEANGVDMVVKVPSSQEPEVAAPLTVVAGAEVVKSASEGKKKLIKKVKKKKVKKMETANENVVTKEEEEKPEALKVVAEATEANPVAIADNIVLRKLLRGPRYFDPPDSSWGTCYNCGEEGHVAVNCKSAKRRKPCFVCGSLEHNAKQCNKGQDCFICKRGGHRAKDCPDKHNGSSIRSKICLKCGYSGHDMFSCRNDYQHDDLKEIRCYVCNSFGHFCCVKYVDSCPKEVSCYRCGQLGHTGLSCTRLHGETTGTDILSSCYRCGERGHFARECTSTFKVGKRDREPSTPSLRFHREPKHHKESKSAPRDFFKTHKEKKTRYEASGFATPQKSTHRDRWMDYSGDLYDNNRRKNGKSLATPTSQGYRNSGYGDVWIMEDPGDFIENGRNKKWSPATPSSRGHGISQSSKRTRKFFRNPNF